VRGADALRPLPSAGRRRRSTRPGRLRPRRADLHRGDVRDQGRSPARGVGARPRPGDVRHEPAERALPRGRCLLGVRPRRGLLRRCHRVALVERVPDGVVRDGGAAGAGRGALPRGVRSARDPRTLGGRARRPHPGPATRGAVPERLCLRSDGRSDAGPVGHARLRPAARGRSGPLGGARRHRAREAPEVPGRHPDRPGHGGPVPRAAAPARALLRGLRGLGAAARAPDARGLRPRVLVHPDLVEEHLRHHAAALL